MASEIERQVARAIHGQDRRDGALRMNEKMAGELQHEVLSKPNYFHPEGDGTFRYGAFVVKVDESLSDLEFRFGVDG